MKLVVLFNRFLRWTLKLISGIAVIFGMIMVGWNSVALYYLVTGRVQADFHQPPITVVAIFFVVGMILLIGGYMGTKRLETDRLL